MSLAPLPRSEPRATSRAADRAARERVIALVTQLEGDDRLSLAEDMLTGILAFQSSDTRGLTRAELSALERAGVTEDALEAGVAPAASMKTALWEREAQADTCTATEAAQLLRVSTARIRQRCAAGTLLAQRRSDGWHLPLFQFPDGREPAGWATVAGAIPPGTPLLLAERVLTTPASRLVMDGEPVAPFEWLANGGNPDAAAYAVDDALNRLP